MTRGERIADTLDAWKKQVTCLVAVMKELDMRKLWCGIWMTIGALLATSATGRELALINEGKPCPIYVQSETAPFGRALARYLKQMSGQEFTVASLEAGRAPEGPAILVLTTDNQAAKHDRDSFVIRTDGDQLRIVGDTPMAAGFAVFAFLEEALGCRWWSWDEEDVPKNESLKIGRLDIAKKAPFKQAELYNREAQEYANYFCYKSRAVHTEQFTGSHTLYPLLNDYAASHPDLYPMGQDGKRAGNNLHFCYLAPGIVNALSDALEQEIVKRKGNVKDWIYFAGMGDWYGGMCQCEACKKVYAEETWTDSGGTKWPGYSATLLRMMNAVGEKLEAKYPGVKVGTFAYMSVDAPPAKTLPRDNVVIWLPKLRYCAIHPVDQCAINRAFRLKMERWAKMAPGRLYIWDYAVNYSENFMYPFPVVRSMAANIKAYSRLGCAGVMLQGNYVSKGGDLAILKNYVWRKLMWNPELSTDALIKEFCEGYYGPASAAMQRYVFLLEDAAGNCDKDVSEFTDEKNMKDWLLRPELLGQLRKVMGQALKAAEGKEPYRRRVKEAEVSLEALDLISRSGPPRILSEKDGYLAVNGQITWARAESLVKNGRNASFKEWGIAPYYNSMFLHSQGGPLVKLKKNKLEVVVAPARGSRIHQIRFQGLELLRSQYIGIDPENKWNDAQLPTVSRGTFEKLKYPMHVSKVTEQNEDTLSMEAECNLGSWHFPDVSSVKTVEIKDDDVVRITGKSTGLNNNPMPSMEQAATVTDYAISAGPVFTVEVSGDAGHWTKLDFNECLSTPVGKEAIKAKQPLRYTVPGNVKSLRISLPGKSTVIVDTYLAPPVEKSEIVWDYDQGILTTEITTAPVTTNRWLEREIKFMDSRGEKK